MIQTIATINPTSGELVKKFIPLTAQELENKLSISAEAFLSFRWEAKL